MKKLVIVESPAKIKTISKFLGKDFKIMATLGHVKDLPSRELGITMNGDDIELTYIPLDKKDKVLADICKEARTAGAIFLAPDPDREGEIIAWHVAQEIEKIIKDPSIIHRISFNEITQPAVTQAIEHPGDLDLNKINAQQARRILDRWVGYEVSPILWQKITKGLSAGRVQSVALRLICDREEEIRSFKPEEYWTIDGTFAVAKETIKATLSHINKKKVDIKNETTAKKIVADLEKQSFVVESIKDTQRARNPLAPFMTSTLQQAAYNQLGFSVQKTMQTAQQLYEGVSLGDANTPVALITYMRTDSLRISDVAIKNARSYIDKTFGKDYLPQKSLVYAKGKAQDAHEAIRPIDVAITPEKVKPYLEPAQAKLYELIWKRFVACQMKAAQFAQRQVVITGGTYQFKATGSTLLFDGFLKVYNPQEDEEEATSKIPQALAEKMELPLTKTEPKQHFTQPPARYTEASLVKELEKEGIGRPSTYATILKTIQARSYTTLDTKKRFIPTELGMAVVKMLTENLPKIMDYKFTALMEEDLDKIAQGSLDRNKLLHEFYSAFKQDLEKFGGGKKKSQKTAEPTEITCPECKQDKLVIRFGKSGPFVGCPRYPECKFTSNFERTENGTLVLVAAPQPQVLEETCPKCGKNLRVMSGRYGQFTACTGYPECKYIHQQKASFPCPSCGGELTKRSWKGKVFWGCSSYPTCKFAISGDIQDSPCPQCKKSPYLKKVIKNDEIVLSCPEKECGYASVKSAE